MDDSSNRREDLRPAVAGQRPISAANQGVRRQAAPSSKSKKVVIVVVAALVALAFAAGTWFFLTTGTVKKDAYQAVFLTNGQVYFGKLGNARGDYLSMSNIYYLQVQQAVQPGETTTATPATGTEGSDNVQLVKLGNELHGPDDQMQISQKQVLFWENLKADGKVSIAIEKYKADNK
ncbi:hypothetical protein H7Y40_00075 [Pedobacter sp.]|nr:hypothetical protein [Candidatus Saccharibacteria bacterium]